MRLVVFMKPVRTRFALQKEPRETLFEMPFPHAAIPILIGNRGSRIKELCARTKCRIRFPGQHEEADASGNVIVEVRGRCFVLLIGHELCCRSCLTLHNVFEFCTNVSISAAYVFSHLHVPVVCLFFFDGYTAFSFRTIIFFLG